MKSIAWYLIMVFLAIALLSLYNYLLDLLINVKVMLAHPIALMKYWTYFVLTKTWLLALLVLVYKLIFTEPEKFKVHRLTFILLAALLFAALFHHQDMSLTGQHGFFKCFAAYLLTGLSLKLLHDHNPFQHKPGTAQLPIHQPQ